MQIIPRHGDISQKKVHVKDIPTSNRLPICIICQLVSKKSSTWIPLHGLAIANEIVTANTVASHHVEDLSPGAVWQRWGHLHTNTHQAVTRRYPVATIDVNWNEAEACDAEPVPPESTGVKRVYHCTYSQCAHSSMCLYMNVCISVGMEDEG